MNRAFSSDDSGRRRRLLVRDAADIHRVIIDLFTHLTLPHVEFHIDSLPPVAVQGAQHRFAQISEARIGALGAGLAATTFLVATIMGWMSLDSLIWTSRQLWQYVALALVAALYAGLIGAGVELVWTRLKLMLLLRRLRRRLIAGETTEEPARYMGRVPHKTTAEVAAAVEVDGVAYDNLMRNPVLSRPRRPMVLLHDTTDFNRVIVHLFTRWTLPIIRISVDGEATLDVQRAQHRIVLLSEACNCVLAAWLAAATLLGGAFSVEWMASQNWSWPVPESWGPLGLVPVVALCAAMTGWAIEKVWNRVRLMLVLHGVRHRLRACT